MAADILAQLLEVEKQAAALVAEAEAEANRRKNAVLASLAQEHAAAQRERARKAEEAVEAERARLAAEREERSRAYRERLGGRPLERERFATAVRRLLGAAKP